MQLQEIVSRGNWRHGGPPRDAAGRSVPGQVVANSGRHQGDDRVERHAPASLIIPPVPPSHSPVNSPDSMIGHLVRHADC